MTTDNAGIIFVSSMTVDDRRLSKRGGDQLLNRMKIVLTMQAQLFRPVLPHNVGIKLLPEHAI